MSISWKPTRFGDKENLEILSSGINAFNGDKSYLSTSSVQIDKIDHIEEEIQYDKRPSRANMQPTMNTVWFARMKESIKILFFDESNAENLNKYILSTGFAGIKVNTDTFVTKFVYYYLFSPNFNRQKDKYATGTTQVAITNSMIKNIVFNFPESKEEQQIIVDEIEKQFTRLEASIKDLKEVRTKLASYKMSILKYAFQGGFSDDSSFPWETIKILEIIDNPKLDLRTGPFGSLLKKYEHKTEGVPVLGIENIKSMHFVKDPKIHISQEKAKALKNYDILPNDIIISRSGTVGEICVVPEGIGEARFSTNIIRIRLDATKMNPFFFGYLFLGSPELKKQIKELCKGTTRLFLNQHILKSINYPFPKIEEQERIVEEIESKFSVIDKLEQTIDSALQQTEQLRKSILKNAFEGKLIKEVLV